MKKLLYLGVVLMFGSCNNNNHCGNGVQDGDETGVDCGGSCVTLCPTTNNNNPPANTSSVSFQVNGVTVTADITSAAFMSDQIQIAGVDSKGTSNVDDDEGIAILLMGPETTPTYYNLHVLDSMPSSTEWRYLGYSLGMGNGQTSYGGITQHSGTSNDSAYVNITEMDWTNSIMSGTFAGQVCDVSLSTCYSITNGVFTDLTFSH